METCAVTVGMGRCILLQPKFCPALHTFFVRSSIFPPAVPLFPNTVHSYPTVIFSMLNSFCLWMGQTMNAHKET